MKLNSILMVMTMAAFGLLGCYSATRTSGVELSASADGAVWDSTAHDWALEQYLDLGKPVTKRLETGLLQVQVPIQNTSRRDFTYQYQFRWFDESGLELLQGQQAFRTVTIAGYNTVMLQGVSPSPAAQSFRIFVSRLNPEDRK